MIDLMSLWNRCQRWPGGSKVFSRLLGFYIPYTASVGAEVVELVPGRSKVLLKDRRSVRNHLNSVHAVALMNVGELSTGLALFSALPADFRGILKTFEIAYHKKSRGTLRARAEVSLPAQLEDSQDFKIKSFIESEDNGELLCEVTATWRVGRSRKN